MYLLQSYKQQASKLAGQIALLKAYSTRSAQQTAQDAVQIFGGRGITQSGMGAEIEHVSTLPFGSVSLRLVLNGTTVLQDRHIRLAVGWK